MPELLKTTEAGKKNQLHHHILFLDYETGEGYVSPGSGSSKSAKLGHKISFVPAAEAQLAPDGSEITPASDPMFVIEPAEDGHTHEPIPYELVNPVEQEEDTEVISGVFTHFKQCLECEQESIEKGQKSWRFYFGDQWEESAKKHLESQKRAALTINEIARYIDELSGYQRQQRSDIHYMPVEGGDQRVADILNILSKTILSSCYFHREESKVFMNQAVPGRGCFNVWVDNSKDVRGDIVVESYPFDGVLFGAHEKEDGSDAEVLFKHRLYSLAKLKQLFPEKADEIKGDFESLTGADTLKHTDISADQYDESESTHSMPYAVGQYKMADKDRKQYRLLERWLKIYVPISIAAIPQKDWYVSLYGWKKSDVQLLRSLGVVGVVDKTIQKIRITRTVGNVVLSDENPADLPSDEFYVVPVYGKKYGNEFRGKVEDAKDPQRQVNFRASQSIDIGNRMCAYLWWYDDTTFQTPADEKKFRENSSTPGSVHKVNDVNNTPKKEEGVKFPGEIVELGRDASAKVGEMMNITPTASGANTSGEAYLQQQKIRLTGNEYLFDNLKFSKQRLGRLIISLVKRYYSPARIMRIVNNRAQTEEVQVGGQPLGNYTEEELTSLLQQADLDKYDVVVGESAESPTARMATEQLLLNMVKAGQQIPPEILIEVADLPQEVKTKLITSMQQAAAAAAEEAKRTSDTEIAKTLAAKGIYTPEVQQMIQGATPPEQAQPPAGAEIPPDTQFI
jgi:hypothetical protein